MSVYSASAAPFVPYSSGVSVSSDESAPTKTVSFGPLVPFYFQSIISTALYRSFNKAAAPKSSNHAYLMFKSMWVRNRERFNVTNAIHQNGPTDCLHFSVEVEIADGWINYLHFYGYLKGEFIITKITACCNSTPEVIATF
jgi:hypothetical protein